MEKDVLGGVWPEWEIVRRIGRGSFGDVYEAVRRDHGVESKAAVKVISIPQNEQELVSLRSEGLSRNATRTYLEGVVNDFVSEIQLMESFKGVQNIVSVEDYKVVEKVAEMGWTIYIRMELLTPLTSYICDRTLREEEVIKLGCDICTALELCAKRNVIHRDIKPENIFINDFGDFKLGDFGIARKLENVSGSLSQKGTYSYMAPEVEKGTRYDATVDLYSLGLVLYRFSNRNRLPFLDTQRQMISPNERMAALRRRLDGEQLPAPCDASPALSQIILRACAYEPGERFASATEMKRALREAAEGTYRSYTDDLSKTVSVRKTSGKNSDTKTQIHRFSEEVEDGDKRVDTFGEKRKLGGLKIAAIILAAAVVTGGGGIAIGHSLSEEKETKTQSESSESKEDISQDESEVSAQEGETPKPEAPQEDASASKPELTQAAQPEPMQAAQPEPEPEVPVETVTPAAQVSQEVKAVPVAPAVLPVSMDAIANVTATSYLAEPEYGLSHDPYCVVDGSLSSVWVENAVGQGEGESITLQLDGIYQVSGFTIHAGHQESWDLYDKNSRPASLLVRFSNETSSSQSVSLEDYFGQQQITFPSPVETSSVTFVIESVYPGYKYQDTVISEISLF